MKKPLLVKSFDESCREFINCIDDLSVAAFNNHLPNKWNAGKELDHIIRSIKPIVKVLTDKAFLKSNFGEIDRPELTDKEIINLYQSALAAGGKAAGKFLPEEHIDINKKNELIKSLKELIHLLQLRIDGYTENELSNLVIPHPLIGKLTIREMMYFTIYHIGHHQGNLIRNVSQLETNI